MNVTETPPALEPGSAADIREAVAAANGARTTIAVRGGGSRARIGASIEVGTEIALSKLRGISDYEPAELVLTAAAGTRLSEIEALLEKNGQMLGFEPRDYGPMFGAPEGQGTIGGTVAANCAGPRRFAAGAARDHFLGFEAVSGRGEIFKGGGKVVKNVTGYDLPKLLAGSWGSLAILTEVTLKVTPRPRGLATVLLSGLTDREAAIAMSKAIGSTTAVTGAAHVPAACVAALPALEHATAGMSATLLRVESLASSVTPHIDALMRYLQPVKVAAVLEETATRSLWRGLRDVRPFIAATPNDAAALWRISVPPMKGPAVAETLTPLGAAWFYDWAGGLVWLAVPAALPDAGAASVRAAAAEAQGHATLIRAPASVGTGISRFEPQSGTLGELARRIKTAFDPAGVLNPGRFLMNPGL